MRASFTRANATALPTKDGAFGTDLTVTLIAPQNHEVGRSRTVGYSTSGCISALSRAIVKRKSTATEAVFFLHPRRKCDCFCGLESLNWLTLVGVARPH
jgi:hypothetical protein